MFYYLVYISVKKFSTIFTHFFIIIFLLFSKKKFPFFYKNIISYFSFVFYFFFFIFLYRFLIFPLGLFYLLLFSFDFLMGSDIHRKNNNNNRNNIKFRSNIRIARNLFFKGFSCVLKRSKPRRWYPT